jgi:hypothetical protein
VADRVLWLFIYMWEDETFASLLDLLKHSGELPREMAQPTFNEMMMATALDLGGLLRERLRLLSTLSWKA